MKNKIIAFVAGFIVIFGSLFLCAYPYLSQPETPITGNIFSNGECDRGVGIKNSPDGQYGIILENAKGKYYYSTLAKEKVMVSHLVYTWTRQEKVLTISIGNRTGKRIRGTIIVEFQKKVSFFEKETVETRKFSFFCGPYYKPPDVLYSSLTVVDTCILFPEGATTYKFWVDELKELP